MPIVVTTQCNICLFYEITHISNRAAVQRGCVVTVTCSSEGFFLPFDLLLLPLLLGLGLCLNT